jgi:DNA-directed RNA polymerase specialized sigma24 family protein
MNELPDAAVVTSGRQVTLTQMAAPINPTRDVSAARRRVLAELRPVIGNEGIQHLLADAASTEDQLREINGLIERAKRALAECVMAARAEGASWERIAAALNLTRQSVHERWRTTEAGGTRHAP